MKRFGREIALLTLPVLVFGGFALSKTRGGSMAQLQGAPSDIYSGKPRLEIGEIKPLKMSPSKVAQGWKWGFAVTVWQGGRSPVTPGSKRAAYESIFKPVHVVYRRGTRWIEAKTANGMSPILDNFDNPQPIGDFALRCDFRMEGRLDGVPRDAEEVRLRGNFVYRNVYKGAACPATYSVPGWKKYRGSYCGFVTQSKPFDVSIVRAKSATK